jgi:PadR family transcriptional regulator PadR
MDTLSGFQRDILWIVAGSDSSIGMTILEQLEAYYEESINSGRFYPNINELVESGLIEKNNTGGRTNTYSITERGESVLQNRIQWQCKTALNTVEVEAIADD